MGKINPSLGIQSYFSFPSKYSFSSFSVANKYFFRREGMHNKIKIESIVGKARKEPIPKKEKEGKPLKFPRR